MIVLVNYSDHNMTISQTRCTNSAYKNGVDVVWPQNPDTVSHEFKTINREIFKHERGAGYWLWKPYHIYKAMLLMNEGDILIYCDSGVEIITPVQEIISRMDEDIFFFCNGHQHVHWCKGDVLIKMGCNMLAYHQQVQASTIFFKVNEKTINFVKEWLMYCQMPGFIDDSPSKLPNHPEFAEHRHDQAILTCLQIKYGYKLHWWADKLWYMGMRDRWPQDTHPPMFLHHRKRNDEW